MNWLLITGDRNYTDVETIRKVFSTLPPDTTLIEGEARGADTLCRQEAQRLGMDFVAFPALWDTEGRAAGPRRNLRMLAHLQAQDGPKACIWFHKHIEQSKGTAHMKESAYRAGVPTYSAEAWLAKKDVQ